MTKGSIQTKRVYTVEHIELQDGTVVEVKPLPIKRSRIAQKLLNEVILGVPDLDENGEEKKDDDGEVVHKALSEDENQDRLMDVLLLIMKGQKGCDKFFSEEENEEGETGRDLLEEAVDMPTVFEIIKVATGVDFPEMNRRMQEMMDSMARNGSQN